METLEQKGREVRQRLEEGEWDRAQLRNGLIRRLSQDQESRDLRAVSTSSPGIKFL